MVSWFARLGLLGNAGSNMPKIPERKRSPDELARMQMQNAMQTRPPVAQYQRQIAHPLFLAVGYFLAFFGLGLLIAPILFVRKPLSRHHAAFMLVLSLILLGVAALYYYENYARYDY